MIGTGPELSALEALARELGIDTTVEWRGKLPHDDIPRLLREQSMFLFASVRDTSGNVLLEAMASGLPAVILSHHGAAEIATDATAIRVPPDEPAKVIAQLADGLVRLATSRELRVAMGREARLRIAAEYAWDRKGEAMNAIYEEAMAT
jgi:glycosyltransferase involved in cell wall biosynthesis